MKPADSLEATAAATAVQVLLLVVFLLLSQLSKRSNSAFITEGALAALMGLAAGTLVLVFQSRLPHAAVKDLTVFDASAFLIYLLPPVIFHAGLGMEKRLFFGNLKTILSMGIVGTVISFIIITSVLFAFTEFHMMRLQDCLALGAIFSATDSVATLQVSTILGVCVPLVGDQ